MQSAMLRTSAVSRIPATRSPVLPARLHRAMVVRAAGPSGGAASDPGYYPLENKGAGISSSNLSSERTVSSTSSSSGPVKPIEVQKVTVSTTTSSSTSPPKTSTVSSVSTTGGSGGKGPSNFGKGGGGGGGGSSPVDPAESNNGRQLWDTLKVLVGITAVLWGLNFLFNKLTKPAPGDKAWVGKAATAEHRAQQVRSGAQDVKEKAKKVEQKAENLVERGLHQAERGAGAVKQAAGNVKDKAGDLLHRGERKAKEEADVASAATRGAFDGVKDTFSNVANKVSGTAESAGANVKGSVQAAANNIKGGVTAAGDKIKGLGGSSGSKGGFPAKTLATVGTIAGATLGAGAVIGGTALYFIDKSRKSGPSTKAPKANRTTGASSGTTAATTSATPAGTATKTKTVEVKTTAQVPTTPGASAPVDQVKATVTSK